MTSLTFTAALTGTASGMEPSSISVYLSSNPCIYQSARYPSLDRWLRGPRLHLPLLSTSHSSLYRPRLRRPIQTIRLRSSLCHTPLPRRPIPPPPHPPRLARLFWRQDSASNHSRHEG